MVAQQTSTDFNNRLGANVRRFRTAAGLSQAELAEMLVARGLSFQQPMVGKVERGERPLKTDELVTIANILGIATSDLLEDSPAADGAAAWKIWQNAIAQSKWRRHQIAALQREIEDFDQVAQDAERRLISSGAKRGSDGQWTWQVTSSLPTSWNVREEGSTADG